MFWNNYSTVLIIWLTLALLCFGTASSGCDGVRSYQNHAPNRCQSAAALADHAEFIEPIRETNHFEAPILVDDKDADLNVRAWRFSYNARGIIEMPNDCWQRTPSSSWFIHGELMTVMGGPLPNLPACAISARPRKINSPPAIRVRSSTRF